jgi:transposase
MEDATVRFGSVDWATQKHSACVVDDRGQVVEEFEVVHDGPGLSALCRRLLRARVRRVAIERPDGPVVEALMDAGLEVVVVSSRSVKALRTRYGLAGNKDDRSDAYVLADCLRTDGHRWPSLQPDQPSTLALRSAMRTRKDLVATRIATANQLRAHLEVVFPGAVGLFADLESPISLSFLERFPTAAKAGWLSEKRLAAWLRANAYCGRTSVTELLRRLHSAPTGRHGAAAVIHGEVTLVLVRVLRTLVSEIDRLEAQIAEQLALHPDGFIFQSLPRAGTVRAAALLAEIGDSRARFPTPDALACLAGAVPSTRKSGKHRAVTFRWACDKRLRDALVDFAQDTRRASPWADQLYRRHRALSKTHPHTARILTRSWIDVIWRCWQDRVAYDPARHRALQTVLAMGA